MTNMIQQQILQQQISTEAILEEIKLDEIIDNAFLTMLALLISPFSKKKQRRKQQLQQLYQNQLHRKSILNLIY